MIEVKVMKLLPNAIGSSPRFMMANSAPVGGAPTYFPTIPRTGDILRLYTLNLVIVHMVYMEEQNRDATIFVEEI